MPVVLNALPAETIESELFGYERGAFTGADKRRSGYLEKAHGGVLFLDEIGELAPGVQIKLLRFLEEQTFQRLGSTEPVRVDAQIVTATNVDLERRVEEGRFREDLYYRLKVHEITVPPLRERAEDIPHLVQYFLGLFRHQGKDAGEISSKAMAALERFDWPGNIRQLKNVLEAAVFRANMHGHGQIETDDLPADIRQPGASPRRPGLPDLLDGEANIGALLARAELNYAEQALKAANGKITEAWELLGYNDRFVFSRRIRRILERYPEMARTVPYVERLFRSTST